jgi:hypothetical protein
VLDASFSFDGVIGALRCRTIFHHRHRPGDRRNVCPQSDDHAGERETLACYRYLEHGAFYAINVLALMMFLSTVQHIPEVAPVWLAQGSSLRSPSICSANRRAAAAAPSADPVKSNGEILRI